MRFSITSRPRAPRLCRVPWRRPILACEALEDRKLLSAAPLETYPAELVPAHETVVVEPLAQASVDPIGLYQHGLLVQTFTPDSDTDVARGVALRTALAAAQDGDEIILGAFTFDMGDQQHVEFPDRVTVTGAGKALTKITSSCPQGNDGAATFTLNNETVIQDLWLEGSLYNGLYQPLVGMQGGPVEDTTAYLRRLKITGDSDGIFVWTGHFFQYTICAYDCEISTHYDAVAILGSGFNTQAVKLYNCSITAAQPSAIPYGISNAVNARSGFVGLYNCSINVTGDANSTQTAGVWTWNAGITEVSNCTFNVSAPTGLAADIYIWNGASCTIIGGQGSGPGGSYVSSPGGEVYQDPVPSEVNWRGTFYNNSKYDDFQPSVGGHDNGAAMPLDKIVLLPGGGPATFDNLTSYSNGINGILVDLNGIHGSVTADDFELRVGNNNAPSEWATAPAPRSVTVFHEAGSGSSDRVELIWDDGTIVNQWLEVTMLADSDTGLAAPYTFYFGNAIGNTGWGDSVSNARVNAIDEGSTRNNPETLSNNIPLTNVYDFNRDGRVNAIDEAIARNNASNSATVVKYLDLSAPPAEPLLASSAVASAANAVPSTAVSSSNARSNVTEGAAKSRTAANPADQIRPPDMLDETPRARKFIDRHRHDPADLDEELLDTLSLELAQFA